MNLMDLMKFPPPRLLCEDIFGETGYRVLWRVEPYVANFEIFEICGVLMDDTRAPIFKVDDWDKNFIDNICGAQPYIEGSIKWDGCSNMIIGLDNGIYMHACSQHELLERGLLMQYLWNRSVELIEHSDSEPDSFPATFLFKTTEDFQRYTAPPVPVPIPELVGPPRLVEARG